MWVSNGAAWPSGSRSPWSSSFSTKQEALFILGHHEPSKARRCIIWSIGSTRVPILPTVASSFVAAVAKVLRVDPFCFYLHVLGRLLKSSPFHWSMARCDSDLFDGLQLSDPSIRQSSILFLCSRGLPDLSTKRVSCTHESCCALFGDGPLSSILNQSTIALAVRFMLRACYADRSFLEVHMSCGSCWHPVSRKQRSRLIGVMQHCMVDSIQSLLPA